MLNKELDQEIPADVCINPFMGYMIMGFRRMKLGGWTGQRITWIGATFLPTRFG
jgi:hypothetical protein